MKGPRWKFRVGLSSLSRRERVILLCLLALAAGYGTEFLVNELYLRRSRELKTAVAVAEEQVRHQQRLLSREEQIHARYRKLESPVVLAPDSVQTETEILRELADLAGRRIHVKSVVPRLGHHEGRQVMFVALDFEGSFTEVVGYVAKVLNEMPSEVSSLSLAPWSGEGDGVVCRMSIRVECFES